jgi:predicted metal-binding membrane protein
MTTTDTEDPMESHLLSDPAGYPPARDRLRRLTPAILLIAVALACWAITAHRMEGMDMGPGTDLGGLGWFTVVWATMMGAMMLPSLVPMATTYAMRSRDAGASSATAATTIFACGYLLTWAAAGVLAYAVVQGVRSLDLSFLAWHEGGPYIAGGVIIGAALYELTPIKRTCLRHCRNPRLLTGRWHSGRPGGLVMGLEHGGFCVGTSWALMAALFAIGVMNVAWMVVMAVVVALEKLLPWSRVAIAATAVFIVALGLAVAFAPHHVPGLTIPG